MIATSGSSSRVEGCVRVYIGIDIGIGIVEVEVAVAVAVEESRSTPLVVDGSTTAPPPLIAECCGSVQSDRVADLVMT